MIDNNNYNRSSIKSSRSFVNDFYHLLRKFQNRIETFNTYIHLILNILIRF